MRKIRKEIAQEFYDLVDSGIHPLKAYSEVVKLTRLDLLEAITLAGIAERLASDTVNYKAEDKNYEMH